MKKFVLITGASSGIGKETAISLAGRGYRVFAGVRTQEAFDELNSLDENIMPVFLDVLDENSIGEAFLQVKNSCDSLYALINNAGVVVAQPVECLDLDDLRYQFEVNTFAPLKMAQTFMPLIKKGRIINISSMASTGLFPFAAPYCASKRALDMLFNSMLLEFKRDDVKIISIKPGVIKTPIWDKSIDANRCAMEGISGDMRAKYESDLEMIAAHAKKNNSCAIEPQRVVNGVVKALEEKNPKLSYKVGLDSKLACLFAKLPQAFLNKLILAKLKRRINR